MENSVKIVLIDTQYVKTDAEGFKSVVQSLTGKDSSVAWIDQNGTFLAGNNHNAIKTKKLSIGRTDSNDHKFINRSDVVGKLCVNDLNNPMMSRGSSFKDFDAMLMDLPPLEDLHFWLSHD